MSEWCDYWLNDIYKPKLKPRTWGTYAAVAAGSAWRTLHKALENVIERNPAVKCI